MHIVLQSAQQGNMLWSDAMAPSDTEPPDQVRACAAFPIYMALEPCRVHRLWVVGDGPTESGLRA
jgi:hypothetical protein